MRRLGQVIGVDPKRIEEYADLHANIWPEIADALDTAQIRNYSIFFFGEHCSRTSNTTAPTTSMRSVWRSSPTHREWRNGGRPSERRSDLSLIGPQVSGG